MDFGRDNITDINSIDFQLPIVPDFTLETLKMYALNSEFSLKIGTGAFGSSEWKGNLLPEKVMKQEFLSMSSKLFDFVELNATFYNTFSTETVRKWKNSVSGSFVFCPKFPRTITHVKRLQNADDLTEQFLQIMRAFENRLGPILIQLPDQFGVKSSDILFNYLHKLPSDIRFMVELRSSSWFQDQKTLEETFHILREFAIGSVINDTNIRRDALHLYLTTPNIYIRFNGNNFHPVHNFRTTD